MITLYHMDHCPYCKKVRRVIEELGIDVVLIAAPRGTPEREYVLTVGGKSMVPFLVDTNQIPEVQMYESDDIITYLKEHYT